jgi:hypothetical protein
VAACLNRYCNCFARLGNIAHPVDIGWRTGGWGPLFDSCSADDWGRMFDDSPEADWDPRVDELHLAEMNLNSRNEREAGHLVMRVPDCAARHRSTALSQTVPAAPDAKLAEVQTAEAACCHYLDAERELAPHAEREPMAVEADC